VVQQIPRSASALIATNACANMRPDWKPRPIQVMPVRDGSCVRIIGEYKGRNYYNRGQLLPVGACGRWLRPVRSTTPGMPACARSSIALSLREHRAIGPMAAPAP
jgi:hypothetical protein